MKNACVVIVLLLLLAAPALAGDLAQFYVRGNVAQVDVVKKSGVYQETLLYVWADSPAQQIRTHLFRCNASILAACGSLTNLLPCASSTPTVNYDPFDSTRTFESYACSPSSRRDAGACVGLSGHPTALYANLFWVYSTPDQRYELTETLGLDVESLAFIASGWVPAADDCSAKP